MQLREPPLTGMLHGTQALQAWQAITGPNGSALRSPHAQSFYARTDWGHVLGWPPHKAAPTNYTEFLHYKRAHPDKLIALRRNARQPFTVVGCDAVIVAELLELKGENMAGKCVPVGFCSCTPNPCVCLQPREDAPKRCLRPPHDVSPRSSVA